MGAVSEGKDQEVREGPSRPAIYKKLMCALVGKQLLQTCSPKGTPEFESEMLMSLSGERSRRRVTPEDLQLIKFPGRRMKNVDHEVDEIQ